MTTRAEIVTYARTWKDVPFRHQGRNRAGIDCAGLIQMVGEHFGLSPAGADPRDYGRLPERNLMVETVRTLAREKRFEDWKPGDFVVARDLDVLWPMHMAILFEYPGRPGQPAIIHSYARAGKVVESRLPKEWYQKIAATFEYRGLED